MLGNEYGELYYLFTFLFCERKFNEILYDFPNENNQCDKGLTKTRWFVKVHDTDFHSRFFLTN